MALQWKAASLVGLLGAVGLNRLSRRSGVSKSEASAVLPGDDVLQDCSVQWTRATTVSAPPDALWPWLVQMGYRRGGWYTSERFDRLVWRIDNPSVDRIVPNLQKLNVGDIVPDGPDHAAYFYVADLRPYEAIVYRSIRHPYRGHPVDPTDRDALSRLERRLVADGTYLDFTWAFALRAIGDGTRLTVRTRANYEPKWIKAFEIPLGLVDFFHVTTIFRGLKNRVATDRKHSLLVD